MIDQREYLPDLPPSGRASSQNKPAAQPSVLRWMRVSARRFNLPSSSVAVRARRRGSLAATDEDGQASDARFQITIGVKGFWILNPVSSVPAYIGLALI
jgi:hypothetical protein